MLPAASVLPNDWRQCPVISAGFTQSYLTNLNICSTPLGAAARYDSRHASHAARGPLPAAPSAQTQHQSSSAPARLAAPCVCYQAKEQEPLSAVLSRAGKRWAAPKARAAQHF